MVFCKVTFANKSRLFVNVLQMFVVMHSFVTALGSRTHKCLFTPVILKEVTNIVCSQT